MSKKKLSTQEILAQLRSEKAGKSEDEAPAESAAAESAAAEPTAAEPAETGGGDEASAPPAATQPQPTPKSTKDILAAARAQAGSDGSADAKPAAAKPAAAKPSSTKDILAAARAQAGGAATTAEAAPAASPAQPVAAGSASAPPAGDMPSVQDMVRAVRGEPAAADTSVAAAQPQPQPQPQAKPKPTLPPTPVKPPARRRGKQAESRRSVLLTLLVSPFAWAWFFLSAATAASTLALARFMMPNVLVEPPTKFKIGPPSDYPGGTVSTKWKAARGVWIINTDQYDGQSTIVALASVCTHLGCTPNWLESEQKFKCPCHGSGFRITGINFEGPAPRPLERVGIRLAEDGMLEVDKSVKFQEELGQWEIPASYYPLA